MSDDINRETLAELRKVRRMFYATMIFVIVGVSPAFYGGVSRSVSRSGPSWQGVTTAMQQQDFPKALSMARVLVASQSDYPYGHAYLGSIYLATGDITNSEAEYSLAYQLFPSEESEKDLAAIRKRLAARGALQLSPR